MTRSLLPQDANELGLGQTWAEDYIEHILESGKNDANEQLEGFRNAENNSPNIAFSKFMKFMHQEGEMPIENIQNLSIVSANSNPNKWAQDFSEQQILDKQHQQQLSSDIKEKNDNDVEENKNDDELSAAAGTWANEFLGTSSGNVGAFHN